MKRTNKLLSITLCVSALLHIGVFLFLTVNSRSHAVSPEQDAVIFSLVNIDILEPELPPQPQTKPEPPQPPPPPIPVVAQPEPEDPSEFIVVEELPPPEESPLTSVEIPVALPPAVAPGKVQTAVRPTQETGDTVAVGAYIQRNYSYIQRRIRDKLVYPSPARRAGIQGVVEIAFTIYRDGKVSDVTIMTSSGQESLDQAAIAAIHAAAPFPAPPAQARLSIPVAFRLK